MEKKSLGAPIYYFTKLDYEVFREPVIVQEPEKTMDPEVEARYYCINLKNGKEKKGIAYHSVPYYPANIPAVKDSVNVLTDENGEYSIDQDVSYLECVNALSEMVHAGTPMKDITADQLKARIQEYAKAM